MNKEEIKEQLEYNFKIALECLSLNPSDFGIIYEYNKVRFYSESNAAECSGNNLYINEEWIDFIISQNDSYDIKYLMYHEARHIYQKWAINDFNTRGKTSELPSKIKQWLNNGNNYQRNVGPNSIDSNADQPLEIDANAFALLLLFLQGIKVYRLNPKVEEETLGLVKELSKKYKYEIEEWKLKLTC